MASPSLWWEQGWDFAAIVFAAILAYLTKHFWWPGTKPESTTSDELVKVLTEMIRLQDDVDDGEEERDSLRQQLTECLELVS